MGTNTNFKFHELDRAIGLEDLAAVKLLLTDAVSMKIKNRALLMAAKLEKLAILEWLIPISDPKFNDSEALLYAIRNKNEQFVALLIPVSNPRIKNSQAVKEAAAYGSLTILKMLVPVSDMKDNNGFLGSPLMIASSCGHSDCVAYLLPLSRPDDKQKKHGETALMRAAASGNTECVDLLLPLSNPDAVDYMGLSAKNYAMQNGHRKLAWHIEAKQKAMRKEKELLPVFGKF